MAEALPIAAQPRDAARAAPADVFAVMPFVDVCAQAQRIQWELFAAWQRAVLAMQKELFDEWVCRWAGGVPIDA